jgi:hypothetical protein
MSLRSLLAGLLAAGAACIASAHDYTAGDLAVAHPYARATAPGQPAGGAYFSVQNRGSQPDRLVSASADVSRSVELHQMRMEGDVMRMRQLDGIDIPPNGTVTLAPGGMHVMLLGLKAPLVAGDKFPMTLTFRDAGDVKVEVAVEAVAAGAGMPPMKHDMPHGEKR